MHYDGIHEYNTNIHDEITSRIIHLVGYLTLVDKLITISTMQFWYLIASTRMQQ